MRAALTARTSADLEKLTADLPETGRARQPRPGARPRAPGRFAIAYKSSIRRGGRWRVPERFTSVVYKGSGWLDLRAAELTAPETTCWRWPTSRGSTCWCRRACGSSWTASGSARAGQRRRTWRPCCPRDAPVVHVRGVAYKGTIEVSTRPRAPATPGPAGARQRERALGPASGDGAGGGAGDPVAPAGQLGLEVERGDHRAARAVSCSQSSAGTRHITSNSMPLGSLAYSDLDTRWSLAPTSAPRGRAAPGSGPARPACRPPRPGGTGPT